MSSSTQTKREKVAAREDAIVEAATRAFLHGGLRAARMAEIAKAADVAEGTLYLYFKNKEALFSAVVARHWRDLTVGASEAVKTEETAIAQLEALARFTLTRILGDWKLFELTFALHYGSEDIEDVSDRRGYVQIFDRVIQRGVGRGEFVPQYPIFRLRDLFFGTIEYAARSALVREEPYHEAINEVIGMLMGSMQTALFEAQRTETANLADRLERSVVRLEALCLDHPSTAG
ncbi:MAG: TetR/AcrR family transcriptional regulator [Pseudomonadota bacterium]